MVDGLARGLFGDATPELGVTCRALDTHPDQDLPGLVAVHKLESFMLVFLNLLVVALVIIGAFAISSSGSRPKSGQTAEDAAPGKAQISSGSEVHQA